MVVATFGTHPLIKPIYGYQLYFVLPRSIEKDLRAAPAPTRPRLSRWFIPAPPAVASTTSGRPAF